MIAVDTSTVVSFLQGEVGRDVDLLEKALANRNVALPPLVLAELLSDPKLPADIAKSFLDLPTLEVLPGYWQRCGLLRARVLKGKFKARIADTLISQSCIDHRTALITRDSDFRAFAKLDRLKLA